MNSWLGFGIVHASYSASGLLGVQIILPVVAEKINYHRSVISGAIRVDFRLVKKYAS